MGDDNITLWGFIFKRYGYRLSENERNKVVEWYAKNKATIIDADDADKKLRAFLATAFPGKKLQLFEEDTSNISYLLMLLDKTVKAK